MKYIPAHTLIAEIERRKKQDVTFRERSILIDIETAIASLQQEQPSLPSNLDEAAEVAKQEYVYNEGGPFPHTTGVSFLDGFKAGAEWMAGQGVNADFGVCKLANRAWLTAIDEKKFMQDIFDNFAAGDKVIVQIRKK